VRLALDHHHSPKIAELLRGAGHDVVAIAARGWEAESDEVVLARCCAEQRALLTNNVRDFATIARAWAAEGRSHWGLLFTSDASLPRSRDLIGLYVERLTALLAVLAADDALVDRVYWL
jgi:predicted nuclease of predicted toxin-antitoxin system